MMNTPWHILVGIDMQANYDGNISEKGLFVIPNFFLLNYHQLQQLFSG